MRKFTEGACLLGGMILIWVIILGGIGTVIGLAATTGGSDINATPNSNGDSTHQCARSHFKSYDGTITFDPDYC